MSTDTRWFNGRFPAGPYLLEVAETILDAKYTSPAGNEFAMIKVIWRLVGTDAYLTWILADTEKARWVWEDFGPAHFRDLVTQLIGRKFICLVGQEPGRTEDEQFNRVTAVLAEVVEDPDAEAREAHRQADNLAQRHLGDIEPMPSESPDAYRARLDRANRAFRAAYPEWQPERFVS